jgi:hypothetical protein
MMDTITAWGPLALGTIATAILGVGVRYAVRYAWLAGFLARAQAVARDVVLEVEGVYVDRTLAGRDPGSPGGVELTAEEQREALALAVTRLLELLGLSAVERAMRILGLPTLPTFVRRYATTLIEARCKELSIEQAAASHRITAPPPLPPMRIG